MCKYCGHDGCGDPLAKGFVKSSPKVQRQRTKAWNKAQTAIEKLAKKRK